VKEEEPGEEHAESYSAHGIDEVPPSFVSGVICS
jgi:hypothetical protein